MFKNHTYQNLPIPDKPVGLKILRYVKCDGPRAKFRRFLLNSKHYLSSLLDNITERFDCSTTDLAEKFQLLIDCNHLMFPANYLSDNDPYNSYDDFALFVEEIPFLNQCSPLLKDLYFELNEIRNKLIDKVKKIRGDGETISMTTLLKQVYRDSIKEYKIGCKFLSFVVSFPVSEAIVESWGSVVDDIIKEKHRFKEFNQIEKFDIVEKLTFLRINGPPAGAQKIENCLKKLLF